MEVEEGEGQWKKRGVFLGKVQRKSSSPPSFLSPLQSNSLPNSSADLTQNLTLSTENIENKNINKSINKNLIDNEKLIENFGTNYTKISQKKIFSLLHSSLFDLSPFFNLIFNNINEFYFIYFYFI